MAFSMFSAQTSPIAIDFGSSSVKLLQINPGARPGVVAAAELEIPQSVQQSSTQLMEFFAQELPGVLRSGRFKGKRAVCGVPSGQTLVQHMQIATVDGISIDGLASGQLQARLGCGPRSLVVRTTPVTDVFRDGSSRTETICIAIARENVMRLVDLVKRCKLDVVGIHTEPAALIRAFEHINQRTADEKVTTLYVDIGAGSTSAAIGHGKRLVFARCIPIGGKHFDQVISESLNCDLSAARAHRLSHQPMVERMPAGAAGDHEAGTAILNTAMRQSQQHGATSAISSGATGADVAVAEERRRGGLPSELANTVEGDDATVFDGPGDVDFSELLNTTVDELRMCLRYHHSVFPSRSVDRVIFLGGEARQSALCAHLARLLQLPAHVGDPLLRMDTSEASETPGVSLDQPQPGWAVACGLCIAPTDL